MHILLIFYTSFLIMNLNARITRYSNSEVRYEAVHFLHLLGYSERLACLVYPRGGSSIQAGGEGANSFYEPLKRSVAAFEWLK